MLFKNLLIYTIADIQLEADELEELFAGYAFTECGKAQNRSSGWAKPLGDAAEMFTHFVGNAMMICQRREEKNIPSSAVNTELKKQIDAIEKAEVRKISRKEKSALRDEILFDAIPKALSVVSDLYAYFDFDKNIFVVNTASCSKAEDLINAVRETLGSFRIVPMSCKSTALSAMTAWLESGNAGPFAISDSCELFSMHEGLNKASFKAHDLTQETVKELLHQGMLVKELRLDLDDVAVFKLTKTLTIKGINFHGYDEAVMEADDSAEIFDADFLFMKDRVDLLVRAIGASLGGIAELENQSATEQLEIQKLHQPGEN